MLPILNSISFSLFWPIPYFILGHHFLVGWFAFPCTYIQVVLWRSRGVIVVEVLLSVLSQSTSTSNSAFSPTPHRHPGLRRTVAASSCYHLFGAPPVQVWISLTCPQLPPARSQPQLERGCAPPRGWGHVPFSRPGIHQQGRANDGKASHKLVNRKAAASPNHYSYVYVGMWVARWFEADLR